MQLLGMLSSFHNNIILYYGGYSSINFYIVANVPVATGTQDLVLGVPATL